MADTTFTSGTVVASAWLNDVNTLIYKASATIPASTLTWSGNPTHTGNHTFSGTVSLSNGQIIGGTYTPTLTNTTNISASTAFVCQYIRVGNIVSVSGRVDIDPTSASTLTRIDLSLPVASTFTLSSQLRGNAVRPTTGAQYISGTVFASGSSAAIQFFNDTDVSLNAWTFQFQYQIL